MDGDSHLRAVRYRYKSYTLVAIVAVLALVCLGFVTGSAVALDGQTVAYDSGHERSLSTVTDSGVEVAVVDRTVQDHDALARAARDAGMEVVLVASATEMEAALAERSGLTAVHVLSHGSFGQVQIGPDSITADTLTRYDSLTGVLDDSLVAGGDVLLYGCRVAGDGAGQSFLDAVAAATDSDVAASDDLTGDASLGGDWDLETTTGTIGAQTFDGSVSSFGGVLSVPADENYDDDAGQTFGSFYEFDLDGVKYNLNSPVTNTVTDIGRLGGSGDYSMFFDINGEQSLSVVTISSSTGGTFDLHSLSVADNYGSGSGIELTSSAGGSLIVCSSSPCTEENLDVSGNSNFQGITSFTISSLGGPFYPELDDLNFETPNTAPSLDTNAGLTVLEGETTQISNTELSASDAEQAASSLTYQVTSGPAGGNLYVDGSSGGTDDGTVDGESAIFTFTQADIDAGNLLYRHRGAETTSDSFDFYISDGNGETTAVSTFSISVTPVNDEPSLFASALDPTFTEGGSAVSLYTGSSASTSESGQTFESFTMTVSNVADGSDEQLLLDGSSVALTHANSLTTAGNGLSVSVSVIGTTATVSATGGTLSAAALQTLFDNAAYRNMDDTPSTTDRVVTITSLQDSGGTANGGDDTASLAIGSTVSLVSTNDEPTLTATGDDPTFTEGGSAVELYSGSSASPVESGQTFEAFSMTVTNVAEPSEEQLVLDGSAVTLTHGNSLFTAMNSLDVSVSVVGSTATVSLSGGALSPAELQTILDEATYQHTGDEPTTTDRVVTITSLQDSGGTASGGDDTAALAIGSTVSMVSTNDEPTLTATGTNPTFTEDGSAVELYSGSTASTVESGQTFSGFTMTVSNVGEPSDEQLVLDGSAVTLSHGTTVTTADNSLGVSVSVVGSTATVSVSGGTLSASEFQTILDGVTYQHTGDTPSTGSDRGVTITSVQDSGGTANGGDDTAALSIGSTVSLTAVNDAPTLTATGDDPTFTEGGSAVGLYTFSSASTVESGQSFEGFTLTVTNVDAPSNEILTIDGSDVALTNGNSLTTTGNSLTVSVAVVGSTATVSVTGGTLSAAALQTLLDDLEYRHTGNDPSTSNRVVTITSLTDSGGTANGGDDTASLAIASTVSVVGVNDEPTLTATGTNPTFTEDGSAASVYTSAAASTIESGQTFSGFTITVTNVAEPGEEQLLLDGSAVTLSDANTLTTATNNLDVSVSLIGTTATVSATGGTLSTAALQTLVDDVAYQHTGDTPTAGDRDVTITSLRDSGGTTNGGDDTAALSIGSTVSLTPVNDAPTLTATGDDPTFTEGGSAVGLYSNSAADAIESGQTFRGFVLTVDNVDAPSQEGLTIDGTDVTLTNGNSDTTAVNSLDVSVAVSGSTATVTVTGGTLSTAALQTTLDEITYSHTGDDLAADRIVTITSLTDSGGTANGGVDTTSLSIESTVSTVDVNDPPTLTATGEDPTFTEGGSPVSLYSGSAADTIETGQTFEAFTMYVTNVTELSEEQLFLDGSAVSLSHGTTLTTADNNLDVSVSTIWATATVTVSGGTLSASELQTILDRMTYQHTGDNPTTNNKTVVTLSALTDSGGTKNIGDDTATGLDIESSVSLVGVNDAPVLSTDARSLSAISEDETENGGDSVSAILDSAGTESDIENDEIGIVVTALDTSIGTWEYSLDGGATWSQITSVSDSSALVLGRTDLLRLVPDPDATGSVSATIHAWDGATGTAGGTVDASTTGGATAYSSASATATITVEDAPEVTAIERSTGQATPTTGGTVDFEVLFSGSVTGVDASDFDIVTTDTAAASNGDADISVTGSGAAYTVSVANVAGDGTLTVALDDDDTITANGVPLGGTGTTDSGDGSYTDGETVTVDNTAPAAPSTPDLAAGSDTGDSDSDNVTSDTMPTLSGTAEANATVEVSSDVDGSLGTTTADGDGDWSLTATTLAEATHIITARATDTVGNTGPVSNGLLLTVDTTAPAAPSLPSLTAATDSGISATDGLTNDTTPTVQGTAEPNATVSLVISSSSVFIIAEAPANETGAWSYTPPNAIAEGTHDVTATATDIAGNTGLFTLVFPLTIDTTAPSTPSTPDLDAGSDSGRASTDDVTNDTTPTLSGTSDANTAIEVVSDQDGTLGTTTTDGDGDWSLTTPVLSEATHGITAIATDDAGNSQQSSALSVTVDTTAPTPAPPALDAASDSGRSSTDDVTNVTTPTFEGTAEADAEITLVSDIDGSLGTTMADGDGVWSLAVGSALTDGTHSLTVTGTDIAGNVGQSGALAVTVDTTVPAAPSTPDLTAQSDTGLSSSDDLTSDRTPTLSGTAEADATVEVRSNRSGWLGTTIADDDGTWSLTAGSPIASGTHAFSARQTDAAGNSGPSSATLNVTVDTSLASITNFALTRGAGQTVIVAFESSEPLSTISVAITGVATATQDTGQFVRERNGSTYRYYTTYREGGDGVYTATLVTARDESGNDAADGQTDSVTVDTRPPTADAGPDLTVEVNTSIAFDAEDSTDGIGIVSYEWEFGDNTTASGQTPTHVYTEAGSYEVTLTVTDAAGNSDTDTTTVTVRDIERPTVTDFSASASGTDGIDISLSVDRQISTLAVSVSGPESTTLSRSAFSETVTSDGYRYETTVPVGQSGTYTVGLDAAVDANGRDGAEGVADRTRTVDVEPPASEMSPTVSVTPPNTTLQTGASTTVDIAFSNVSADTAFALTLGAEDGVFVTGAAVTGPLITESLTADAGVLQASGTLTTVSDGTDGVLSVTIVGTTLGNATLALNNVTLTAPDGDVLAVALQNGTVRVVPTAVEPVGGTDAPMNLDADPLLEDVDGNGVANIFDAIAYYNARNSGVVQNNPAQFDFDGDGTAGTLFDTIALYNEITG